jgi:hypothetical protein
MNTHIPTLPAQPGAQMVPQGETAGQAAAEQARALVESRYAIAARFPRDIDVVRGALLRECKRPFFAKVALYSKPVGGTKIIGPSIRFAETAIRCMSNISIDTMTVYDDREKRLVRVTVADLESNVTYAKDVTITKAVERKNPKPGDVVIRTRQNSYNESVSLIEAGDDEIANKEAALLSKTIRTLGLRLVPGDLIDEAIHMIYATQAADDAKDPDAAKRTLFDAFAVLGVTVEQLKDFLGNDATTLSPKELTELRALYSAVRDGEVNMVEAIATKHKAAGDDDGAAAAAAAAAAQAARDRQGKTEGGGAKATTDGLPQNEGTKAGDTEKLADGAGFGDKASATVIKAAGKRQGKGGAKPAPTAPEKPADTAGGPPEPLSFE